MAKRFKRLLPPVNPLLRKVPLPILIGGIFIFHVWLIYSATRTPLPTEKYPLYFYSNQTRQDIKSTLLKALRSAHHSIYLSVYSITDAHILSTLKQKSQDFLPVQISYDSSASLNLHKHLPLAKTTPLKTKGLMHRKIVVIDETLVFLGSANLTTTSLKHHGNIILGLHHKELAHYLKRPFSNRFDFEINTHPATLFLLPDPKQEGYTTLLSHLAQAKSHIQIAMFTLTHQGIADALIAAHKKGVHVSIAIDYYTAKGSSKKLIERLQKSGITCIFSKGKELLHHKWALIDNCSFFMGSANWTQAAFNKNQDFLLHLSNLKEKEQAFLKTLWEIIEVEGDCQ